MTHCDRCPLRRHKRPCPSQWPGCEDACRLVGWFDVKHRIIEASSYDCSQVDQYSSFLSYIKETRQKATTDISHSVEDTDTELVVAAYKEDIGWLKSVRCRSMVYSSGGQFIGGSPYVNSLNTGREAYPYLCHIVSNYKRLAPWTVFAQGNPFEHSPDFIPRLSLKPDHPISMTKYYLSHSSTKKSKKIDIVETYGGFESRYGDTSTFGEGNIPHGRDAWLSRVWGTVFDCPQPSPQYFGFGAMWVVPREFILARPVEFWRQLRTALEGIGGKGKQVWDHWEHFPVNAWGMEAIWKYLFDSPLKYPHRNEIQLSDEKVYLASIEKSPSDRERTAENVKTIKECVNWTREGCGCQWGRCLIGKGDGGLVNYWDCCECLGLKP